MAYYTSEQKPITDEDNLRLGALLRKMPEEWILFRGVGGLWGIHTDNKTFPAQFRDPEDALLCAGIKPE